MAEVLFPRREISSLLGWTYEKIETRMVLDPMKQIFQNAKDGFSEETVEHVQDAQN
jgi:hypothetical protein